MSPEEELIADIAAFDRDPLGFARYAWDWGCDGLSDSQGPRNWQVSILKIIGEHLNSQQRFTPLMLAVSSGHGIGKSALIAMICNWAMSTSEDCRVIMTANTEAQLRTKTWPECAKWFASAINADWWNVGATTVSIKDKAHERLWRVDAIPWSENNTEAFAGLHNKGKRIVVIYDEASAISDKIWEVTEGTLTDSDTEIIWIAFGNPTKNTGRFKRCFGDLKHRWITKQIDSRTVEGTNKDQLDKWIADYGEDSDFCRVRVRGEFPRAGSTQFISGEVVAYARRRQLEPDPRAWPILSVDVARFGDDATVIGLRQGNKLTILDRLRGMDTAQVAIRVMWHMRELNPRVTIIDGDGIGGGVIDYVRMHNADWLKEHAPAMLVEFHGGSSPDDPYMYFNRRAEVWGKMRAWLVEADIPDNPEIEADLCGPEYFFSSKNQIQLERKEDMKKRGLSSPDIGDMLAMSFSVQPPEKTAEEQLRDRIAAASPFEAHMMRMAETAKREQKKADRGYWEP